MTVHTKGLDDKTVELMCQQGLGQALEVVTDSLQDISLKARVVRKSRICTIWPLIQKKKRKKEKKKRGSMGGAILTKNNVDLTF